MRIIRSDCRSAASGSSGMLLIALSILLACVTGVPVAAGAQSASIASAISLRLTTGQSRAHDRAADHGARRALGSIYANTADRPLWSVNGRATAQALALVRILRDAQDYGLEPRDYDGDALAALARRAGAQQPETERSAGLWAQFDVRLTMQALHLVCDLHYGRINPSAAGFALERPRRRLDLDAVLRSLARSDDVRRTIVSVEPTFYPYRLLEQALGRYRQLAARDESLTDLPPLPRRSVKAAQRYRGAPALRRRLRVVGDLPAAADDRPGTADSEELDPALVSALERFQRRHGLAVDGILGPATFRQLTTPFAMRVRQIELNLERLRWLPDLQPPLVIVNIPQFHLYAFHTMRRPSADTLQMNVIVGRTASGAHTPTFITQMKYVVFRPYWNVPRNITVREMLPDIRAKRGYLASQHLQIVRGESDAATPVPATAENLAALAAGRLRLRQLPGPENALGLIKFGVPNPYDVLLHSTPARWLFSSPRRAFSHGCIRVSDPAALAVFALSDTPGEWSREKIEAAMNGPDNRRVELLKPIPVIVLYETAFATAEGEVLFFRDLYGEDSRLEGLLGLTPLGTRARVGMARSAIRLRDSARRPQPIRRRAAAVPRPGFGREEVPWNSRAAVPGAARRRAGASPAAARGRTTRSPYHGMSCG